MGHKNISSETTHREQNSSSELICMGSIYRIFYFPFKRLAKHSAVKLLVLLAGVYLLITFFGLPDYIQISSVPRANPPSISQFDQLTKNENPQNHELDLAVYESAEKDQKSESFGNSACKNYSQ